MRKLLSFATGNKKRRESAELHGRLPGVLLARKGWFDPQA